MQRGRKLAASTRFPFIAIASGICAISPAAQADITFVRSIDITQVGPNSYEVTCYSQYLGIDSKHEFYIGLYAGAYNIGPTYPYGADIGPTNKRVKMSEPGVWEFVAVLRKNTLTATVTLYLNETPPPSSSSYCQGGGLDRTANVGLPQFLMYDYFR